MPQIKIEKGKDAILIEEFKKTKCTQKKHQLAILNKLIDEYKISYLELKEKIYIKDSMPIIPQINLNSPQQENPKKWIPEEEATLKKLLLQGLPQKQIAIEMNRTLSAIEHKKRKLVNHFLLDKQ